MDSTVRVLFLGDASSAVRSVSRLESGFGSLGRTAKLAGAAVAVGIVGGLAAATKAAIDFDKSMRNVNSIAKLNERQFQALSKEVLNLGKTTGQAPKVLADGLYDIVSSGFKANDAIKILAVSAKAATAGMTNTATASKAVVAILNAYHLEAGKARNVSSLLFTEVNKGVNTFEELAQNIGDTAPLAAALKIPFSDVSAGLALITLHGTSMAEAATQMSRVLTDLLKPSKSLKKELQDLGFENGQAAIKQLGFVGVIQKLSAAAKGNSTTTADWFKNIRSLRGMLNLTGPNLKQFNQFAQDMSKSFRDGGADVAAFNEQSKSISVQWAKAKAGLTAAMIPIGQLFFPLLQKAAAGVQTFAQSVQTHMPQIKQDFASISAVVGPLAGAIGRLATVAISPLGIAMIGGAIAATGLFKALVLLKTAYLELATAPSLAAFLRSIGLIGIAANPIALAAAVIGGVLVGAFILASMKADDLARASNAAAKAIDNAKRAGEEAAQSERERVRLHHEVTASVHQITAAQKNYNAMVRQFGPNSLQAKQALDGLNGSIDNNKQLVADAATADRNAAQKKREHTQELVKQRQKINDVTGSILKMSDGMTLQTRLTGTATAAGRRAALALQQTNLAANPGLISRYAREMDALATMLGKGATKAGLFADATGALADALGRLPTRKEVSIYMRTFQVGKDPGSIGGRTRTRAGGGFIPMSAGTPGTDSVPAMLTPGEIVLNRGQQEVLGGPRFLQQLFGFRGDAAGPGFAAGGIVSRPKTRKARRSPHSRYRVRPKVRKARAAFAAVEKVNQREEDLDRSYGQLVSTFDETQEVFIVTDPVTGIDSIDQAAINQRLSEIDQLLASRDEMLALIDEEKSDLRKAIAALRKAIAALQRQIRAETRAARQLAGRIAAERRKKKPNQNLISRLENQRQGHESRASNLSGQVNELVGDLGTARHNLHHELPFSRRDVQIDEERLRIERKDIAGTTLPPGSAPSGTTDPSIQELLAQIGRLNLALGIQGAQAGVLGSFQRGALHVPTEGLYHLHSGERVTPAGVAGSTAVHGEGSPIQVTIVVEDGAVDTSKIKAIAVGSHAEIDLKIQREFDKRRRSGVLG